jgi:DNA mismatch repair ATPase MutS
VVNIAVQIFYKPRVKEFIPAIHELPAFLTVAAALGAIAAAELSDETRRLRDGAQRFGVLRRATVWLTLEPGQSNAEIESLYEYVNMLFLFDVNAFVFATTTIQDSSAELQPMFEAIGFVDAAQSIARWRATLPKWTRPEFTRPQKSLDVDAVFHPLLENPVANSLAIDGQSLLITGSNKSGKTTFVRTLGVNAVLAQTVHTVCARRWAAPMLRVRTSIGRADSLIEGRSYYLAEIEAVLALVESKEDGEPHLFLLDEIFRGTNTTERVAAASAVLANLDHGRDIVVVATHDIEVLDLLNGAYAARHFREQIENDALTFDYRIQAGRSSTRNAIALLKFMRYPEGVVADALNALDWAERRAREARVGAE